MTSSHRQGRKDEPRAKAELSLPLSSARPDRIYTTFAETGFGPLPLREELCPRKHRAKIAALAQGCAAGRETVVRTLYPRFPFALSKQEYRVATLAAQHFSNKAIAARMGLLESTVKQYLHSAFAKMKIKRRAELAELLNEGRDWSGKQHGSSSRTLPYGKLFTRQ